MAQAATGNPLSALVRGFFELSNTRKIGLIVALAALISLAVGLTTFATAPTYRVLFANVSEKDGGEIIAALAALNVPYRMSEGGGAIEVPANQVYETRLKLAAQGLPRGGGIGFELMENQKFGTSQFVEQVNYQRALEGELARTVQSLNAVQGARVHLAIPRPTVFIRENQKPSASVMVSVYPGRSLDAGQVESIVHLVASSVSELSPRNVTVVDQTGNLLSAAPVQSNRGGVLDASQLKFMHEVEARIGDRIEAILRPITGPDNARAQVAATLDFSEVEQTSETFRPNPGGPEQAIRSAQSNESTNTTPQAAQGVPGALSNQPPGAATAPLVSSGAATPSTTQPPPATSSQKESTINYELDKTIRHTKGEIGTVKRLSVAVVVNFRRTVEAGKTRAQPLSDQEMAQINDLVKEAMGFNKDRGDTVNVVNAPFQAGSDDVAQATVSFLDRFLSGLAYYWPDIVKWLIAIGLLYFTFRFIRPIFTELIRVGGAVPVGAGAGGAGGVTFEPGMGGAAPPGPQDASYDADLRVVRDMAKQDPKIVAQVVKDWVGRDE